MRILFVNPRPYLPQLFGGVHQTTFELERELARMGHETAVMCGIVSYDAVWLRSRIVGHLRGRAFPAQRYRKSRVYRGYEPLRGFEEVVSDFHPDVVVTAGGTMESFELAALAARSGVPGAFYFHEISTLRALKTPELLEGLALVANSTYTAGIVAELLGRPSTVIPPLISRAAYQTVSSRRFVTMVNPRRVKGGQTAYELARACPDIPFVFVEAWTRDDPFVAELRGAAQQLPNVKWLRPTPRMRKLYGATRILLAPSECEESWGRVASEAHLSGIPVLASSIAALPESVGPGGILVDPGAPLARWVEGLRSMWDDATLYTQLSAQALEFSARPQLQPLRQAERFLAVLREQ